MENEKVISHDNFRALIDLNRQLENKIDKLQRANNKLTEMVQILKKFNYMGELFYDIRNLCNERYSERTDRQSILFQEQRERGKTCLGLSN